MNKALENLYEEYAGSGPLIVKRLEGAGSNREYYRLTGADRTFIGVIGSNPEENKAFCRLAAHFRSKGINVPEILAVSSDFSCYIQEDLGNLSLFDAVTHGRETGEYGQEEQALLLKTVAMLPKLQLEGARGLDFSVCYPEPSFGRRMIMSDLNYFKFCFLKATGVEYNEVQIDDDFSRMADDLMEDAGNAFMHRDFQARNVMLKDGEPYFIDFQGGRRGPVHYDLASFVWQARARYPETLKEKMIQVYLEALSEYVQIDEACFRRRLRLFVLFRTLQVLGAYGFRGYFERKSHFLRSIPFAVANLRGLLPADAYPALDSGLGKLVELQQFAGMEKNEDTSRRIAGDFRDGARGSDRLRQSVQGNKRLTVDVYSFSYRKGLPEDCSGNGGGYVFDCRSIHNPGRYEQYRKLTGKDREVIDFLETDGEVYGFLNHVYGVVDPHVETFMKRGFTHLMVSFGCTGGQHRSVYCAESLARHLLEKHDVDVVLTHREQMSWPS